eukprot:742393-Amorphochlora_amoeboformis.AAC.1
MWALRKPFLVLISRANTRNIATGIQRFQINGRFSLGRGLERKGIANRPFQGPQPRWFSGRFSRHKEITRLEKEANATPGNAEKQRALYTALLKEDGGAKRVVTRFERYRFAADLETFKLYMQALIDLGQIDRIKDIKLENLIQEGPHGSGQTGVYTGLGMTGGRSSGYSPTMTSSLTQGSSEAPVYVKMQPDSFRNKLLGSLISTVGMLLVTTASVFIFFNFIYEKLPGITRTTRQKDISPIQTSTTRFDDVKGCKEAKQELEEIVQFLKNPEKFTRLGGQLPRGVLLMGPPGTGKTLLAKAVAGEAGVPFFSASASEFEEMYVGVGARRVRELFNAAKERSPCLVFIDEIDAIGGSRKSKEPQTMRLTLNQLLVELDGFNPNSGIIVLAATNFPEMLDRALTRAGRFDRHITVPLPDVRGRKDILKLYTSKLRLGSDVNVKVLAQSTPGYSGAELSTMVNDAAIHASMRG